MPKPHGLFIREIERDRRRSQSPWQPEHPERPQCRSACKDAPRPCPFVTCRYHLFLDANTNGTISFPHGRDLDALHTMPQTCALDVADDDEQPLSALGKLLGMSTEGVRIVFWQAVARLGNKNVVRELAAGLEGCDEPEAREGPERELGKLNARMGNRKTCEDLLHGQ